MMNFTHLHLHNEFSVLDGVGTSKQYAELAKDLGQTHLALTNHGNIDGAIIHQKECQKAGIKPIIGCEMYMVPDISIKSKGEKRYHITLLVQNQKGWNNLLRLLSISNIDGFYYKPRIDHETLIKHLEGLILLSACSMSFLHMPWVDNYIRDYLDIIDRDRIFFEVMPHSLKEQEETNKLAIQLSNKYNIPLVATNDCHYPTEAATKHQEVLLAIQTKKKWKDPNRWKFDCDGLFLRSWDEMFDAFKEQGVLNDIQIKKALRRTNFIAGLCEGFRIEQQEVYLPSIKEFSSDEAEYNFLYKYIRRGKKKRLPHLSSSESKIYNNRIKEELDLITSKGFIRYFLMVWDLIKWCKNNDIMTGPGRGSVGGSLIAYLLYITDCDPIEYDLEFFRFISIDRNDLPDIDMDFEDDKCYLVRQYLEEKYGKYNVVGLSNYLTMKGKGVLRDVSRVFDIPLKEVDIAAKSMIEADKGEEINQSFEMINECKSFGKKYPEVVEIAKSIEGQIRGLGKHAAAVCISKNDLRDGHNCNISKRSNEFVANWDMRSAEYMGLMKLDVLKLSSLTVLNQTAKMIKKNHGINIDLKKLTFDDPKVFDEISDGETTGAFQIGSRGLTNYCEELGIDDFSYLYAAVALWRPGPIQSGMAESFIKRKDGKEKIEKIAPIFDKITEETFGLIVYQEQVMKAVNQLAGIPMSTCNKIRKVMGKSQGFLAFDKYKEEFILGCRKERSVTEKQAQQIWLMMSKFGGYGFNKSHAVEYSMITYWDMWCKTYYPNEYLACCLTKGDKEKNIQYIREAKRLKLKINLPKIGLSDSINWIADTNRNLFAPFISINGVGAAAAEKIKNAKINKRVRKGFFSSTPDHQIKGVNKSIIKILKDIRAFDPDIEIPLQDFKKYRKLFTF